MNRRGVPAENLAAAFLEGQGLKILERNYRCRFGEIDLIASSGATLVFVEVRARRSSAFGGAAGSITAAKRRRLVAAALSGAAPGRPRLPLRRGAAPGRRAKNRVGGERVW
jgi:putative endonuclease